MLVDMLKYWPNLDNSALSDLPNWTSIWVAVVGVDDDGDDDGNGGTDGGGGSINCDAKNGANSREWSKDNIRVELLQNKLGYK